ncbi:MAG: hypothetical protein Ct9H300mP2_1440 [Candidatus Neomarinimicrobiota bacterium]|nr:MAG: hypothetical protein Ct9H300mP2_1440 [Candidatus Neomarinimicrobiota bacterium]
MIISRLDLIPLITLRRRDSFKTNQPELALKTAQAIEQTSLSDRSIILSGQIYEQVYNDKERAWNIFSVYK